MEERRDIQNPEGTPQPTAAAPQRTAVVPQKTAAAPQKTAVAPQKTAAAPQKTAVANGAVPAGGTLPANGPKQPGESITAGGKSYKVEKLIGSGSEGDIYVVSDGKRRYALKKCHPGYHTNMKVMPKLQKLNDTHMLVEIVDFGDDFELLEFVSEGSAASANIKGNAEAILALAVKTAFALDAMHKAGVIHKDIKPANILLRDKGSWDSALCDFGIADVLTEKGTVSTTQTRTPIYAAPEVYSQDNVSYIGHEVFCELTPKADFYSLGMTILSLWMGEESFRQLEHEMSMDKKKGRIPIPDDMPDPLNKICRGLLIRNAGKRWDLDEIKRTLNNEDVPVEEDELIEDLNITFNAAKHLTANTPKELAECMAADPELAIHFLYNGDVERWLKDIYPGLAIEMNAITETRFQKDQQTGLYAAMCALNPKYPFKLSGTSRETGERMERECVTLKDVSNFCNDALLDDESIEAVESLKFKEWVRMRDASVVNKFPDGTDTNYPYAYMLRIQMIDPLTDINLRNDPNHPDYAMTGESIGRFLNKIYNIYWNICENKPDKIDSIWKSKEYAPQNREISVNVIFNVAASIIDTSTREFHYLLDFFRTKGNRFKDQIRWFLDATDENSEDYQHRAGPTGGDFFILSAWMKIIKGFGATPEYLLTESGKTVTTLNDLFKESKKTLKYEYEHKGLHGFLAVNRHDDPTADLKPQFAYEKLLKEYVEDLEKIDDKIEPVARFNSAVKEADRLLSEGKSKIRTLNARNMAQYILTMVLAVIPAALLLAMLVFSIIENPLVDTSSLHLQNYIWTVGLVLGVGVYIINLSSGENIGCLASLIGGVILAVILYFLVKFLGQFILYFYAFVVLVVLAFFSKKTIFSPSVYATRARKFTKPGFEEKVLEPLYFAFNEEEVFDSSLNGAFNDEEMQNWKGDLRVRRIFMLIFIGVVWFLLAFSMLIPKSERFSSFTTPLIERWFGGSPQVEEPTIEPYLLQPLQKGDKGEEVVKLQMFLREQGYTSGRADGDFGPGTEKAVKAFQEAIGLEATGIVDYTTIEKISEIVAATPAEKTIEEDEPVSPVKSVQTAKPETKQKPAEESKPVEKPKPVETPKPQPEPQAEPAPAQQTIPSQSDVPTISLDDLIKLTNQNNNP